LFYPCRAITADQGQSFRSKENKHCDFWLGLSLLSVT
jgi:hypothetical protein